MGPRHAVRGPPDIAPAGAVGREAGTGSRPSHVAHGDSLAAREGTSGPGDRHVRMGADDPGSVAAALRTAAEAGTESAAPQSGAEVFRTDPPGRRPTEVHHHKTVAAGAGSGLAVAGDTCVEGGHDGHPSGRAAGRVGTLRRRRRCRRRNIADST